LQLLAIFIQLLQRLVTTYEVNIGSFTKFHPFDALVVHLCILVLGYLSAIYLPVHDVLQVCLGSIKPVDSSLKFRRQLVNSVRLHKHCNKCPMIAAEGLPLFFLIKSSSLPAYLVPDYGTGRRRHQAWIGEARSASLICLAPPELQPR
jgi:hypothetical protein